MVVFPLPFLSSKLSLSPRVVRECHLRSAPYVHFFLNQVNSWKLTLDRCRIEDYKQVTRTRTKFAIHTFMQNDETKFNRYLSGCSDRLCQPAVPQNILTVPRQIVQINVIKTSKFHEYSQISLKISRGSFMQTLYVTNCLFVF
jgi:hypothetical protein